MSSFADLGLSSHLCVGLENYGYTEPTAIQRESIPVILTGSDLIGQAQTGTGKTAAFALPILNQILEKESLESNDLQIQPKVLVLTPTRELAIQVAHSFEKYGGKSIEKRVVLIYGGQAIKLQFDALRKKPLIIVATPGRLIDHLQRGSIQLDQLESLILDEADEMLKLGFRDEVESILSQVPQQRQTLLFSATMPPEIEEIAQSYLKSNHQRVLIKGDGRTSDLVEEGYLLVKPSDRFSMLLALLELELDGITLVFAKTRKETTILADRLQESGFAAEALSGELTQNLREAVIKRLKEKRLNVVVATDVAARGLDIDGISLVINIDVPYDVESYIHRVGRTGRAGQKGRALVLVTPREIHVLEKLERALRRRIQVGAAPKIEEIRRSREKRLRKKIQEIVDRLKDQTTDQHQEVYRPYYDVVNSLNVDDKDKYTIAIAALILASNDRPLISSDLPSEVTVLDIEEVKRKRTPQIKAGVGCSVLVLHSGKLQGVRPKDIVGAISHEARVDGSKVGAIRIEHQRTLFELPNEYISTVISRLSGKPVCGKPAQFSIWEDGSAS